ncbi:MarR family transcriptional regulator [Microcoleus sp. FACHB-SPT15]|uniref:MarR family winged helix-turn-helix transcriptional regulator n=1 Tax=Microcoleus sp. FACHB-SPT15 TaxID=2692830 RepID=UPI00177EBA40|nr:MarR family transcriptional regulator [Microcoleus sp. FACHB-SPT15]MBD1808437.1 MarR family transcriptional regulator [Microcoleus sp. FACHB-SPT15]
MVTSRAFPDQQALLELANRYPEFDLASVETCLAFLDTTADVYEALDAHFARYGLSMGKFTLLMQLLQAPEQGLTPSDFAERAGVTRATITGLLDGLEREGWLRRQPYPSDRRMLSVQLTDKGQQLLSQMLPDHFCRTTGLMANLTTTEKKTLIKLLAKVRTGTPAMREP